MARARDPARDKAKEMYLHSEGKKLLKDIAAELGKDDSLVRKWKRQDEWDDALNGHVSNETIEHVSNEVGAPKGNKNAKGNRGNSNPVNQFPKRNSIAMKHGFYSKLIPDDMQELFEELDDGIDTSEMLWDQIKLQYIAIMRAQKIMYVTDKDEMIKELKKFKPGEFGDEEEYQFQFAWERQAQFLTAQSRAISELRTSIKQFEEMADANDERLLKLKKMRLDVKKAKVEIAALNKSNKQNTSTITIVDAWAGEADE